jgi:hypothetical protein
VLEYSHWREPPEYVLAGLREVDPGAQALWWGTHTVHAEVQAQDPARPWKKAIVAYTYPVWLIGVVSPMRYMHAPAARRLRQLEDMQIPAVLVRQPEELAQWCESWRQRWRSAHLTYQGFVPKFFWPANDLDWSVVAEFEAMGWFARHLFDIVRRAELQRLELDTPSEHLTGREALLRQAIAHTMPSIWRHVFRGRRSIMVPAAA